jgi:hypothetical protein
VAYCKLRTGGEKGITLSDGEIGGPKIIEWLRTAVHGVATWLALGAVEGLLVVVTTGWLGLFGAGGPIRIRTT